MSLEILISKYIDGELTPAEDAKLREILRVNQFAREKFNSAVELHMDIREDADNIKAPATLLKKTEDRVLMEIMKAPGAAAVKFPAEKSKRRFYSVAAVISLFMLAGLYTIFNSGSSRNIDIFTDNAINSVPAGELPVLMAVTAGIENTGAALVRTTGLTVNTETETNRANVPVIEGIADSEIAGTTSEIANTEAEGFLSEPSIVTTDNENPAGKERITIRENSSFGRGTGEGNGVTSMIIQTPGSGENLMYGNFGNSINTRIELSTQMSTGFINSGLQNSEGTALINYSQSIGYSYNEDVSFGLEFGLTEFTYDHIYYISVPAGNSFGGGSSVEVLDPVDGDYFVPVKINKQHRNFWATAFYDHKILKFENFSVQTRLGLGFNSEGPMGYGRALVNYKLFNGFYLNAGIDGRAFIYSLPMQESGKQAVISGGMIYGVQLSF
jgi:hypothetical protein